MTSSSQTPTAICVIADAPGLVENINVSVVISVARAKDQLERHKSHMLSSVVEAPSRPSSAGNVKSLALVRVPPLFVDEDF